MGGTISITIRLPDGKEYRTQRWTNSFPYWFQNVRFLNKDIAHIQEYLSGWVQMKDDYESGQFKLPYTSTYFPSQGLVPLEYGLIVVDMQNNEILDCFQDYSHIDKFFVISRIENDREEKIKIDQLLRNAKVLRMSSGEHIFSAPVNYQSLIETMKIYEGLILELDMTPFKLTRYEAHQGEIALAHVKQLGFKLSDQEEHLWKTWIKVNGLEAEKS
jgi:hypothetical protein